MSEDIKYSWGAQTYQGELILMQMRVIKYQDEELRLKEARIRELETKKKRSRKR
tara:strand:- start:1149 stop:1310 length:162 start_codon:yes stop_codon:yes gene_type:complete